MRESPLLYSRGRIAVVVARPPSRLNPRSIVANSRSARKRIRANERKHVRNRAVRSTVRTKVAKARRELLSADATAGPEELRLAISALDRAAEKGILHRKNASRRKSRLMSLAAKLASAGGAAGEQAAARAQAVGGEKGRSTRGKGAAAKTPAKTPAKAAAKKPAVKSPAKSAPAKSTTTRSTARPKKA
jgi:small subunit ribosomal protein S20